MAKGVGRSYRDGTPPLYYWPVVIRGSHGWISPIWTLSCIIEGPEAGNRPSCGRIDPSSFYYLPYGSQDPSEKGVRTVGGYSLLHQTVATQQSFLQSSVRSINDGSLKSTNETTLHGLQPGSTYLKGVWTLMDMGTGRLKKGTVSFTRPSLYNSQSYDPASCRSPRDSYRPPRILLYMDSTSGFFQFLVQVRKLIYLFNLQDSSATICQAATPALELVCSSKYDV